MFNFIALKIDYWHRKRVQHYQEIVDKFEDPTAPEHAKIWKKYWHHSRAVYRFEQKRWTREIIAHIKESQPYGACYWVPQILIDMVERSYEYWNNGYDVHAADPWASTIREQVNHAWELAQNCMLTENYQLYEDFDSAKLVELFTYVAQHVNGWSD